MGKNDGGWMPKVKHWRTGNKPYYNSLKQLSRLWAEVVEAYDHYVVARAQNFVADDSLSFNSLMTRDEIHNKFLEIRNKTK